ncbi:orotate phosphoribosyltransferase [Marinilactibacillus psychrotolerans]|uniref:Orotate phosphoribosyltransferase n=1 Tax=Marinilactibacillus psychrotolerans TaxID=191770 RepID=A0AAV3W7D1_9LACT|nr:orotate phosphoribosyltransferase [Marinilactibacillus psychrotolerans]GEL66167.1 orotate phosphoribosyltransferase [Marinilactibacillus psychrotolerans]GEQ34676.1 orotate phosphoribosyltransferase [Marinilactibacillus psychrotolerans]SDB95865.1 orotate phosphoribosyltransferase [Marinilactibacillus psychrotolerans]
MSQSIEISRELLNIGAVSVQPNDPFTWTSGLKSPIYCDNRITMSFPEVRSKVIKAFVKLIKEYYPQVQVIAGTATAGIPHAAWIAQEMNLPMVYIRSSTKQHGKGKQIEGIFEPGAKMVIIEDLISTGSSVINALQEAEKEGAHVLGVAAIFTYELPISYYAFNELQVELKTITNYTDLIEVALQAGVIKNEDINRLKQWKNDPKSWQ